MFLEKRKWQPVVKKFHARLRWVLDLHTHSYWSICRRILQEKICLFAFPLELISCMGESRELKYTKRNCNNRRMFCEVGEPLFLIRRVTLQPLIEDTSDKFKTLEGVILEQRTPYFICIWN